MAYIMNDEEKAERSKQKAIHTKLRAPLRGGKSGSRYDLLAWAYARGFKFRRCERNNHVQLVNGNRHWHFKPASWMIWERLVRAGFLQHDCELPEFAVWEWERIKNSDTAKAIEAWLDDPAGAIAAPAPKAKKPYAPAAA